MNPRIQEKRNTLRTEITRAVPNYSNWKSQIYHFLGSVDL